MGSSISSSSSSSSSSSTTAALVTIAAKLLARDAPIVHQDVTHASAQWMLARNPAKNARTVESPNLVVTLASAENAPEKAANAIAAQRTPVARLPAEDARTALRAVSPASAP